MQQESARLQQRLVAVNDELDALQAASAASAAAAERQLQQESALSEAELKSVRQEVYQAAEVLRGQEAKVQEQLVVLSHQHAEEVAKVAKEWQGRVADVEATSSARRAAILDTFDTALLVSTAVREQVCLDLIHTVQCRIVCHSVGPLPLAPQLPCCAMLQRSGPHLCRRTSLPYPEAEVTTARGSLPALPANLSPSVCRLHCWAAVWTGNRHHQLGTKTALATECASSCSTCAARSAPWVRPYCAGSTRQSPKKWSTALSSLH